jgi:hypothetical protein
LIDLSNALQKILIKLWTKWQKMIYISLYSSLH